MTLLSRCTRIYSYHTCTTHFGPQKDVAPMAGHFKKGCSVQYPLKMILADENSAVQGSAEKIAYSIFLNLPSSLPVMHNVCLYDFPIVFSVP